ncbi:MAG: TIGR02450 family Trp-rich protein [Gammaproteobacteria bacterium]
MNQVSPKKLLHSKWTAVTPVRREKHFMVTAILDDESGQPVSCCLEAVHSGKERTLPWRELKDATLWRQGWV